MSYSVRTRKSQAVTPFLAGVPVGGMMDFPTFTYDYAPAWLPVDFNNAVSIHDFPELYARIGNGWEDQHVSAGDPATDATHFYPTPIPGGYSRTGLPNIEFTDADIIGNDLIENLSSGWPTAYRNGSAFRWYNLDGAIPPDPSLVDGTLVYIKFNVTSLYIYPTELDAISNTNRITWTPGTASGTFRLTQEGLRLESAVGPHGHVIVVNNLQGDTVTTNHSQNVPRGYMTHDGEWGHGMRIETANDPEDPLNNETRPVGPVLYTYIKASIVPGEAGWTKLGPSTTTGISGGSAGITTLIPNSNFEVNIDGVTSSGALAARTPENALEGAYSLLMKFDTAFAGNTVDIEADIAGKAHQSSGLKVEFYCETGAGYADSSVEVYLLCDAQEVYIGTIPESADIQKWTGYVTPIVGATVYKLRFKTTASVVLNSTLLVDEVVVVPASVANVSVAPLTASVDSDYTVEPGVNQVFVDTTSGNVTITIPAGLTVGSSLEIVNAGSGTVTISSTDGLPFTDVQGYRVFLTKYTATAWKGSFTTDTLYTTNLNIDGLTDEKIVAHRDSLSYANRYNKIAEVLNTLTGGNQRASFSFIVTDDGDFGTPNRNMYFVFGGVRNNTLVLQVYKLGNQNAGGDRSYFYGKKVSDTQYEIWCVTAAYSYPKIIPLTFDKFVPVYGFNQSTDPTGLVAASETAL